LAHQTKDQAIHHRSEIYLPPQWWHLIKSRCYILLKNRSLWFITG